MYKLISIQDFEDLQKEKPIQLIDVRSPKEYQAGHIAGALNIHEFFTYLADSSPQGYSNLQSTFQDLLSANGIRNDIPIVSYEQEMSQLYGASCRAAFILMLLGHKELFVLHGGLEAWNKSGRPLATDTAPAHTTATASDNSTGPKTTTNSYQLHPDTTHYCDAREMQKAIDNPAVQILDNRDHPEWIGISSSPYGVDFSPRKGRIPGAIWLEWYDLMEIVDDASMFKKAPEIKRLACERGLDPEKEILVYCFKGCRASNTLLALHDAGFQKVKVYFGSWYEWAQHPEYPVDETILD